MATSVFGEGWKTVSKYLLLGWLLVLGGYQSAYAAEAETPASDFEYTLNSEGDAVVITRYKGGLSYNHFGAEVGTVAGASKVVVIPAEIEGFPVKKLGHVFMGTRGEYSGRDDLTSIIIPEGVTEFENTFYRCSGLTKITIPNSVTSLGWSTFVDCIGLTSITIPDGITQIGGGTFHGCSGLTSVTLPSNLTSIGNNAFAQCSGLTSIIIPNNVTFIGENAFGWCSGLTSITVPNGVTSIKKNTFIGCSGLTSITIPSSVTSIEEGAFSKCNSLTSITLPDSVTKIGKQAFAECKNLVTINILGDKQIEWG